MTSTNVNKAKLVDFIKRYNLNKTNEKVKLIVKDDTISCYFINSEKTNIGYITMNKIGLGDSTIGVYNTSSLLSLLDFLSDTIDVQTTVNQNGIIDSLEVTDGFSSIKYTTCDPDIIDYEELEIEGEPEYDFNIILNEEFITNFLKSISALSNCEKFTVISNGKKTELLMNYNSTKSNTAKFKVETVDDIHNEIDETIVIKTDFIKRVLENNRNNSDAYMSISKEGLVKIQVNQGDFTGTYFMTLSED